MKIYRLKTAVTEDGIIILPKEFESIFAHQVEIIIKDKTDKKPKNKITIPVYSCGGKVIGTDLNREEIYDNRL